MTSQDPPRLASLQFRPIDLSMAFHPSSPFAGLTPPRYLRSRGKFLGRHSFTFSSNTRIPTPTANSGPQSPEHACSLTLTLFSNLPGTRVCASGPRRDPPGLPPSRSQPRTPPGPEAPAERPLGHSLASLWALPPPVGEPVLPLGLLTALPLLGMGGPHCRSRCWEWGVLTRRGSSPGELPRRHLLKEVTPGHTDSPLCCPQGPREESSKVHFISAGRPPPRAALGLPVGRWSESPGVPQCSEWLHLPCKGLSRGGR